MARTPHKPRRPRPRLAILAAALVVAAIGAYLYSTTAPTPTPTAALATTLTCTACKHSFQLSPAQIDEQISARKVIRVGRGLLLFPCPGCSQTKARVGAATIDDEPPPPKSP